MSNNIHLYSNLPSFANDQVLVEVHGDTVGQCLADLISQFPRLKSEIFDKNGKLSNQIYISINLESPRSEQVNQVVAEKDEIYVIRIVAGG
jgi:molybdopterin converting factor small subunit